MSLTSISLEPFAIPGATPKALTGTARSQVRNPTFSLNMVHPNVVRKDEPYRLYATVTNTSSTPGKLFSLALDPLGMMGVRLAEGEAGRRTVETLGPGETYDFAFELVATENGEVAQLFIWRMPASMARFY